MTIAVNNAGDVLTLADNGAWQPATIAHNQETGARLVLDGGAWKPAPSAQQSDAPSTEFGDLSAQPWAQGEQPSPSEVAPAGRIMNAAAKGWNDTPTLLGPETQAFLDKSPIGQQIINPAAKLISGGVAAGNAGMAALSQAAMEVFGEKGGRDALALLSTLPVAAGERMSPNAAAPPAATAPAPRFVSEAMMPPDTVGLTPLHRALDLIRHDDMENGVAAPDRGVPNQGATAADVMRAPDLDSAIAAANDASRSTSAPYVPVTVSEVATRDGVGANEAYRRMVAENAARQGPIAPPAAPVAPEPALAGGPAEPQSLGAAASREMTPPDQIALSTTDMKANRYQAEMGELLEPPKPNDKAIYVKDSLPTLAEHSGDPEISQTENMLRQRNSAPFFGPEGRITKNNVARVTAYDDVTPSRTALDMMRDQREDQWIADTKDLLPNAKPVDLTPVSDWVNQQLSDPTVHEVDAVRSTLEGLQDRLADDDGNPKTDPAAILGIHKQLQNQLAHAKDPLNATPAEKYSFNELMAAKKLVDGALNASTDNRFQTALDNFAKASQDINAGEELEAFRPKLTNSSGTIMAERFHNFVISLAALRGKPGIDPAMSISDGTMRQLINIDSDLKRAGQIKLGGAAGSPTDLYGTLAEATGLKAAHSLAGSIPMVGPLIKTGADLIAQRRLNALTAHHLAPPEGGYVYPQDAGP